MTTSPDPNPEQGPATDTDFGPDDVPDPDSGAESEGCPFQPHRPGTAPTAHLPKLHGDDFATDPNATYDWLRAQGGPVHPVELAPGVESLLVVGYQAALEVLRSPYFSKDAHRWEALEAGHVPSDSPILPIMGPRKSLWFADGQEHLRLRTPVDHALGGIDPRKLRACVQRSAVQLIEEFAPDGEADLVSQYAGRIPMMVLTQLFGCPDHLNGRISAAFLQMVNGVDPAAAQDGLKDLVACLTELIEIKRRTPGDDVTSRLLERSADVSQEELIDQLVVITGAGQVPGTAWISTAIMMLLSDDRFAGDLTGGSLTVSDALNEVLWLHAPHSNYSFVYAIEDYLLRDPETGTQTRIPPGVPVTISHAAANLDPSLPTSQSQRAANTAHLAFSAGPHACPAQDVATIIAEVAIEVLLDRLPEVELAVPAEELTWRPGPFIRALTDLPVRFTATPAASAPTGPSGAAAADASAVPAGQTSGQGPDSEGSEPAAATPPRRRWSFAGSRRGRGSS